MAAGTCPEPVEGYGGLDNLIVQAALCTGVPACDTSTGEQFEYAYTLAAPFDSAQDGLSAGTADGLRVAQSVIRLSVAPSVDTFAWDWASGVPGQCTALS